MNFQFFGTIPESFIPEYLEIGDRYQDEQGCLSCQVAPLFGQIPARDP